MKIENLTYQAVQIPHEKPIFPSWFPKKEEKYQYILLVGIHTDAGIVGYASMEAPFGILDLLVATMKYAREFIIGEDPFHIESIIWKLRNVARISTRPWIIENALLDVVGKACQQPVYKVLGAMRDRVKLYASWAELRPNEQRREDALRLVAEGFKAVKIRFTADTLKEDISQVEAIRAAVGDKLEIMVDANQGTAVERRKGDFPVLWSYERARDTAKELEKYNCTWLEEPLYRYNFEGLARLSGEVAIPIAGGEINHGLHEFKQILQQKCFRIVQPNCTISEGITQIRKIAAMAEAEGIICNPHAWIPGIGLLQSLHLAASISNCDYLEYPYDPPALTPKSFQGILAQEYTVEKDGYMSVPQAPGFGYILDEEKINRYSLVKG